MIPFPIRLTPGQDLRAALEAAVQSQNCRAAFVLSGIGSLSTAGLRFAGADQPERLTGDMEIVSLAGTVAFDGTKSSPHLHMVLSTSTGDVLGGHVAAGCVVRTTAEVLLALLPEWEFAREPDAVTGFDELVVRVRSGFGSGAKKICVIQRSLGAEQHTDFGNTLAGLVSFVEPQQSQVEAIRHLIAPIAGLKNAGPSPEGQWLDYDFADPMAP